MNNEQADEELDSIICSLPDGFRYGDDDYTRVHSEIDAWVAQHTKVARKDELSKACHEWEKHPELPATYLINRTEEIEPALPQATTNSGEQK